MIVCDSPLTDPQINHKILPFYCPLSFFDFILYWRERGKAMITLSYRMLHFFESLREKIRISSEKKT